MSESSSSTSLPAGVLVDTEPPEDLLRRAVAETVLAEPGVLRIEPTLLGAVRALRGDQDPGGAVQVTVRAALTDVTVHLAVRADHEARLLAHRVHAAIAEVVTTHGGVPGSIDVSILAIEPV